jgi:hypothetical protein
MKTLQEQYNLLKEGKGNKQQFFKSARHLFPDLITPVNTFEDTVRILKNRGIIAEGIGGVVTTGKKQDWHTIFKENINKLNEYGSSDYIEDFEEAKEYAQKMSSQHGVVQHVNEIPSGGYKISDWYDADTTLASYENGESLYENKDDDDDDEKYKEMIKRYEEEQDAKHTLPNIGNLKEAKEVKAIEKETTKEVTDMATRGYDYKDEKNYDNVFGQEFLKGFYTEMQDSKNEGKTVEELRQIVAKNLAKDCNHYVKDGQFGLKGVGYTMDVPGLGESKPAKGKHKSSGYGDLQESILRSQIHLLTKEVLAELYSNPTK